MMAVMTLKNLRVEAGMTINRLSQEAGVTPQSVKRAEQGELISPATAKSIAEALSRLLGRKIRPGDIEGLNIM